MLRNFALIVLASSLLAAAPATRPAPTGDVAAREVAPGRALAAKLPDIKFNNITLTDAIDFIRDVSDANIHVNWRALELLNVTRQTTVSLQLSSVTTRRVLRSLLDETGAGEMLTFYVDDGVIEVTTKEISDAQLITKVYPVEDLVMTIPNFGDAPSFNLQNQTSQTSGQGGGGGGGGGQSLFGAGGAGGGGGQQEAAQSKQQRAGDLVTLIMETVRPEVWRENGGTASVRYFNGHLIVTAPRSVHETLSVHR
ncbi:MAG: hypothetical protein ABIP55_07475 [Tepidisphaeraceae bacterium]